ncbi:MAG: D-2-hydroxyacid dehydrogenase [Ketobacteraceae bacterium]|nr:D-2-hydroxyacid dehydrogenase [Ketobacteraceae bacterium]
MKAVFLDARSMGNDLDFSLLESAVDDLVCHDQSSPEQAPERLRDAGIAIVNKVTLDRDILEQCPDLKLIAVTATGTNNIDLEAARSLDIRVCNATRYGRASLVQHNFSLLLALAGNLLPYLEDVRAGRWQNASQFCLMDHPIMELEGKTMGIIGYGDLGQGMAYMARAFGMDVLVASREGHDRPDRIPIHDLLPRVDVLSVHCLLSEETRNLITLKDMRRMKPTAFLLNTARGGIVSERDLVTAVKEGIIAGAGVDVLTEEPPRQGNPLLEESLPNLLVTPHCAWASREARQRILTITSDNIRRFRAGKAQAFVV